MKHLRLKNIVKTGVAVSCIYIAAIYLSLFISDRMEELETNQDRIEQANQIVLALH